MGLEKFGLIFVVPVSSGWRQGDGASVQSLRGQYRGADARGHSPHSMPRALLDPLKSEGSSGIPDSSYRWSGSSNVLVRVWLRP